MEGAIKLAKLYTKKNGFIVAVKAFHGKTMGSLSMMGKADYRQPPGMLYGGPVYHVPFGDADAVERQLDICQEVGIDIAAVLMEPIQGEAGAIVPPDDFWPRLREMTKRYGVLLIADEVQTGFGRTGKLWGVDHWDVAPDIMARGQVAGRRRDADQRLLLDRGDLAGHDGPQPVHPHHHHGRRPLACSAAIAPINVTLRERLWEQAAAKGDYLIPKLRRWPPSTRRSTRASPAGACSSASTSSTPRSATRSPQASSSAACSWRARSPARTRSASSRRSSFRTSSWMRCLNRLETRWPRSTEACDHETRSAR